MLRARHTHQGRCVVCGECTSNLMASFAFPSIFVRTRAESPGTWLIDCLSSLLPRLANLVRGPEACNRNELQVSYNGPHKSPHAHSLSIRGRSEANVRHASLGPSEEAHHCTGSHPHTFTSSHLHILTSSPLPSHPHILTPSHPHTFTSSHPHILTIALTSSHPHTFTSSHLHILTSSPLPSHPHHHTFTSSHLHILTSSHLHILTIALTPSHPHRSFVPSTFRWASHW